jgi:hypothetical protein
MAYRQMQGKNQIRMPHVRRPLWAICFSDQMGGRVIKQIKNINNKK